VTHFSPPELKYRLEETVRFFGAPFELYEEYLETDFPYSNLQMVRASVQTLTPPHARRFRPVTTPPL
jgi:hypothetical protein